MKDVVLTTDLYHKHADPNDHWNLASMFSLAYQGLIRFAGIMCDDDRSIKEDGSFLHFGDPSVQSVAQMNFITGMAVPVGFGSRRPIKTRRDLDEVLKERKRISSVTLLLDTLQRSESKVDIHMCGSCKDVVIAYNYAPELFEKKCDCIYLNAGTYDKQEPLEYNVSLEPYAFSQIFSIPCTIRWSPCFDSLKFPFVSAPRASYYDIEQGEIALVMSQAVKKYFNFMYGKVFDVNWLHYLRSPLDEMLVAEWASKIRQMWSTPGFLLSAGKTVTPNGDIVDITPSVSSVYGYRPVSVKVSEDGHLSWCDTESSNVQMFVNAGPDVYPKAMREVVKTLIQALPDIE